MSNYTGKEKEEKAVARKTEDFIASVVAYAPRNVLNLFPKRRGKKEKFGRASSPIF